MNSFIERFKVLKNNRRVSLDYRAKFVSIDVNFFLLGMCIFFGVFYLVKSAWVLAALAIVEAIVYFAFFFLMEEHYDTWVNMCFVSVLLFTVVNSLFTGWQAGFQNFLFAEVVAFFLPNIRSQKNVGKTFSITTLFVVVYMVLFVLFIGGVDLKYIFDVEGVNVLYFVNTIASFFTIMMFAYVYSTHSEKRLHDLSRRADFDELTKIYNRYAINQILEKLISDYEYDHKPFTVAILDIDFFKKVNDTYGHNAGDDVLKGIATMLKKYSKTGATVGRWGGEEFVIIAQSNVDKSKFIKDLESIRKYVNSGEFVSNDHRISITVSIGVEHYHEGWGAKEVIEAADKNLYRAKETGRNKVVY